MKSTVVLGPEHDEALQKRVIETLRELGADMSPATWALAGSQEIISREASLKGRSHLIESETYVGLTLTGDADLVARVVEAMRLVGDD